jgi:hypothetical protein
VHWESIEHAEADGLHWHLLLTEQSDGRGADEVCLPELWRLTARCERLAILTAPSSKPAGTWTGVSTVQYGGLSERPPVPAATSELPAGMPEPWSPVEIPWDFALSPFGYRPPGLIRRVKMRLLGRTSESPVQTQPGLSGLHAFVAARRRSTMVTQISQLDGRVELREHLHTWAVSLSDSMDDLTWIRQASAVYLDVGGFCLFGLSAHGRRGEVVDQLHSDTTPQLAELLGTGETFIGYSFSNEAYTEFAQLLVVARDDMSEAVARL